MQLLGRILFYVLSLSAAVQVAGSAQQKQPPAKSSQKEQAGIAGTIINSITGEPLEGVHVRLVGYGEKSPSAPYGAMTDVAGHFSITALPPAYYEITLERHGFIMVRGRRGSVAASGDIELKPGEQVQDISLRMAPQAIISGRVLDEYGDPMISMSVHAYAVAPEKILERLSEWVFTNDRGEFRISVEAGKYHIYAGTAPLLNDRTQQYETADTTESVYRETYYPSATAIAGATQVEAKPGREISGLEIRMARSPRLHISGIVLGIPDSAINCHIIAASGSDPSDMTKSTWQGLQSDSDGKGSATFHLVGIARVDYRISARCLAGDHELHSQFVELSLRLQRRESQPGTGACPGDHGQGRMVHAFEKAGAGAGTVSRGSSGACGWLRVDDFPTVDWDCRSRWYFEDQGRFSRSLSSGRISTSHEWVYQSNPAERSAVAGSRS
jgi:hypothetical protein